VLLSTKTGIQGLYRQIKSGQITMYLSVHRLYRHVETMRPEISDEVQEMVETSAEELLDNPALSVDDLTFEQMVRMICIDRYEQAGDFPGVRSLTNAPWNK
jgi:hypothetical protein